MEREGERFETLRTKKKEKEQKLSLEMSNFCSPPGLHVLNAGYRGLGKQALHVAVHM